MRKWLQELAPSLLAVGVAMAASALVVWSTGGSPTRAFQALVDGAFGSRDSLAEVAVKACPLLFTGLAVALAFRAGIWNIGAEGQLLAGALSLAAVARTLAGLLPAPLALFVGLTAAAAAGGAWAALAAALKLRRGVNEVIATIMLNFIAAALVSYLVQGPLMERGGSYPQTDALGPEFLLPRWPPYRLHLGLVLALLAAAIIHFGLFRLRVGFELRAAGLNPVAARLAGIPVQRRLFWAFAVSGALAGLAGGVELSAVTRRLYERFSPGWGYTAIAVGLLGRLSPAGVVFAALFFGALDAGSNAMQRSAGVSAVVVYVVQGCVILFLAAFERWRGNGASAR
ncbi:MAG: ABC transporter permease [Candidatus Binatia bacterium]|nr:MAG: ABC transporter permease [Candidatus Binatia bacterium]